MNQVIVIIVNYYTEEDVHHQLMPFKDTGVRFIVVDNGSRNRRLLDTLDALSNVEIVSPGKNLGYLNGGFFGLKTCMSAGAAPDWVIISNPDIAFTHAFFEKLSRINAHRLAMLAPRIVSARTGKDQNPFMITRPLRKKLEMLVRIHKRSFLANLYRLAGEMIRWVPMPEPNASCMDLIYAPHGSCMIFANSFLMQMSSLYYPAFLFCEELFFAEQAVRQKLAIQYRPDLEVRHEEHRTTRLFRNRDMVKYQREALEYCLNTYYPEVKGHDEQIDNCSYFGHRKGNQ